MIVFVLLALIFLAVPVEAAMLRGTLYEVSMDKARDVTVDISTLPQQRYVSKDGTYSFKVAAGNYSIKAQQYKDETVIAQASETINIADANEYQLDMILFPIIEPQDELLGDAIFDIEKIVVEPETPWWMWLLGIFLIVFLAGIGTYAYVYSSQQKKAPEAMLSSAAVVRELDKLTLNKALKTEEQKENTTDIPKTQISATQPKQEPSPQKDDLQTIVSFIETEGGRTTQKELRRHFSYSEAKISLMIAELEHKGKIEKIKKGRGNILIAKHINL